MCRATLMRMIPLPGDRQKFYYHWEYRSILPSRTLTYPASYCSNNHE